MIARPVYRLVLITALAAVALMPAVAGAQAGAAPAGPGAQAVAAPAGNASLEQPPVPGGSRSRTKATGGTFEAKYVKIRDMIATNDELRAKIRAAAARFRIDPVHIVGALVGEHTYNVDAYDRLQTYLVKAASYLGSQLAFAYESESVTDFVERPQFAKCRSARGSYTLWTCREAVWEASFRGRRVGGKAWPNDRFGRVFFQPLYAGQTFGLGQINPLAALGVDDLMVRVGHPSQSASRAPQLYAAIMDPNVSLDYIAAIIRTAIDAYGEIAGIDISGNPGLTATLYNLGDVRARAEALRDRNGGPGGPMMPRENYYGWLVNDRLSELEALVR